MYLRRIIAEAWVKENLYGKVGGKAMLEKVHRIFYDKVYAHPWLGKFFEGHSQASIEHRQTTFMAQKMGGDPEYMGKELKFAHETMYITPELLELRSLLLDESIREAGVPDDLRERWMRIDNAFGKSLVKPSLESFLSQSWPYKKHIVIPEP